MAKKKKLNKAQRNFIKKHPIITLLIVLVLVAATVFLRPWEYIDGGGKDPIQNIDLSEAKGKLQVHYIDVGQADSILAILPTGETLLIDAGASNDRDVRAQKGADYLINYLKSCGVTTIDYMILTHPHSDHIASADEVITEYGKNIKNILLSDDTSSGWERVAKAMQKVGIGYEICEVGNTYSIGKATLTILGPVDKSIFGEDNKNNYSIVCRLAYGDTSFVFTGDAETVTEKGTITVAASPTPHAEILAEAAKLLAKEVGHHGSTTSSCEEFLRAVDAGTAVICCGAENSYGHPTKTVLNRLEKLGYNVLRTDLEGTIILISDGKTVSRLAAK